MGELVEPTGFSGIWMLLVLVLVAALIVWFIMLPILTKKRVQKEFGAHAFDTTAPAKQAVSVRQRYHERIDSLVDQHSKGSISERELHLEMSATIREYVALRLNVPARTMTLTELQLNESTSTMAAVIAQCYHPAFSQAGTYEVDGDEPNPMPITVANAHLVVNEL